MLATATSRNDYIGAGSVGPFPYTFKIWAASDLRVVKRNTTTKAETVLAYPADYAVTGIGKNAGGNVTLTVALLAGNTVLIKRVRPLTQTTDLRNQGTYFREDTEDTFDKLVMIDQQQQDALDRSFKLPETFDPAGFSTFIRELTAGYVLTGTGVGLTMAPIVTAGGVALPGEGRTTANLTSYLFNNRIFNILDYSVPVDGVTDATAAFTACDAAAAAAGGVMLISPCINGYKVSGFIQTCKRVIGYGLLGKLTTTINAAVWSFGADDLTAQDIAIQGNSVGAGQHGFDVSNRSKFRIINPTCTNLGGAGIHCFQTLGAFYFGGRILNPECYGCNMGIYADVRAEYVQVVGGHISENTTGIYDISGNLTLLGTHVVHNTDGFRIDNGANDSHGSATACKINHNTQYAVRVNGITNGFVFNGCHIYEHDIWLKNCVGVQFIGGLLSVSNFYFEGSVGTLIENNVIDPAYGNLITNDLNANPSQTQWRNNRRFDGTVPTFLENINGGYISGGITGQVIANTASGTVIFSGIFQKLSNHAAQTKYAFFNAGNNRFKNFGLGGNKVRVQLFIKCSYTAVTTDPRNVYADIGYYVGGAGARFVAAAYLPIQVWPGPGAANKFLFIRFEGNLDLDANDTIDVAIRNDSGDNLTVVASESYIRIEGL